MIESLNGIYETVNYHDDFKMRIYWNEQYEDYPQHCHNAFEIIMPVENIYKVVIDEEMYNLNPQDIIIIPSNTLHQLYAPSTGYRIIMQFDRFMFGNLDDLNKELYMFYPCVTVTSSSMSNMRKELSSLILSVTTEYFSTLPFREPSIYSMLLRFFTILGRYYTYNDNKLSNIKCKKPIKYMEWLDDVCRYINGNCTENIKIDDVANVAGFSKSNFARLFKQSMDISWYDYLNNCRIMHAEKLLLETDLPIMQVAMKSGFGSIATFNRLFRTKKHCTPTEYKTLYLNNCDTD
ncbi:MAG: AraC family transcriptional regulator [Xylanivirga thermophila]|uniref:AraC family transcriptional regulator n=1 Tax=Xylanivirga thermophila TaxID=2496273 RepID=UPI0039F5A315